MADTAKECNGDITPITSQVIRPRPHTVRAPRGPAPQLPPVLLRLETKSNLLYRAFRCQIRA